MLLRRAVSRSSIFCLIYSKSWLVWALLCLDCSSRIMRWDFRLRMLLLMSSSFFSPFRVCRSILLLSILAASSSPSISCYLCFSCSWIRQSMHSTCNSVIQNACTFFLCIIHEIFPSSSSKRWCPSVVNYILNSSGGSWPKISWEYKPSFLLEYYSCYSSLDGNIKSGLLVTVERLDWSLGWN